MQLEGEGLPLFELEIVHVGLADQLDLLPVDRLLVRLLHQRLDGLLSDDLGEATAHDGGRRLTRPKPRQPYLGGVALGFPLFGIPHLVRWDGDGQQALDPGGLFGRDLYGHAGNVMLGAGLEPARLSTRAPKTLAATVTPPEPRSEST